MGFPEAWGSRGLAGIARMRGCAVARMRGCSGETVCTVV